MKHSPAVEFAACVTGDAISPGTAVLPEFFGNRVDRDTAAAKAMSRILMRT
jgi:hypothetical protein